MSTLTFGAFLQMNKTKIIGIGAISRVGKDTFANCLIKLFERDGYVAKKYSLAYELKKDMSSFLKEKCHMDVWTENTTKKSEFRDILVSYGKIQRARTKGTYWTNIVQKQITEDAKTSQSHFPYIAIVSDIRYAQYEKDEHFWVKSQGGSLIYLERWENEDLVAPANIDEMTNSPLIKDAADYSVVWNTMKNLDMNNYDSYHYNVVKPIYYKIKSQ